jgi:peptide deformylase
MTLNGNLPGPWPIRQFGDPVLRERTTPFAPEQVALPDTQDLINAMIATLHASGGVGLAAPQVGQSRRLIVLDIPAMRRVGYGDIPASGLLVLLNPELVEVGADLRWAPEACLSINAPNGGRYEGTLERPDWVRVRALDRTGREIVVAGDRMLGRALQHELDHLEGILFVDRIADPRDLRIVYPVDPADPVLAAPLQAR